MRALPHLYDDPGHLRAPPRCVLIAGRVLFPEPFVWEARAVAVVLGALLAVLPLGGATAQPAEESWTSYVNPFVGTAGDGSTYPGAVVPWGMVSVSPLTDLAAPYVRSSTFTCLSTEWFYATRRSSPEGRWSST